MSRYRAAMDARERWNARYAEHSRGWLPDAPSQWLVAHGDLLAGGGRALDVACGDGRNALYLARRGYTVDAIDVSDVAIDALRAAIDARDLSSAIVPRVVDLEREPLPPGPYHAIVMFNFLQRDLFGALQEALAPGGLLIVETLSRAHVDELGHDFNPAYLLEPGELLRAFGGLKVLDQRDGVVQEARGARGVGSIVVRRPAAASTGASGRDR